MQYRTLESLCKIASGGTPSRSKKEYWDGGDVPWIKIGNIKSKVVSNADEYITEAGLNNSSAKLFKKGTILYTIFATLGEVGILDFDACTNQAIAGVSIEKPEEITADYLYYYLKSKKAEVNKIGRGVAQNNINLSILRKFLIPMRAIEEQKTIVNSLNKIESIIEKQKQQLEQLNNLIKARFVEMFGENDATSKVLIGDAVELINGRAFKPTDWTPTGLPIIRIQNLNDTKAPYNYFYGAYDKKNYIKSGELLFSWSGTPGTSFGAFIWNRGPGLLNQHIFRVLPKKDYDLNFLRFALNAQLDEIISKAHGGVGLQHITKSELEKIAIPYPNRKLQAAFSAFVAQIDKSKFALQNSIISLMNLWYNINQYVCERTYGEA